MTLAVDEAIPPAIAHSVLNSTYLAHEVQARYALKGTVKAQLLYRGMNDVYVISDEVGRYALRVWRAANYRPLKEDVAFELDYLDYLKGNGFPASAAIHLKDGSNFFCFDAPEGVRPIALYDWAPGAKFGENLDVGIAEQIGNWFAKMHLLGLAYTVEPPQRAGGRNWLIEKIPYVAEFVSDRPDDVRDYEIIAHNLTAAMLELDKQDVPRGICHSDFHPSNVHVSKDGTITFLDFDGCAEDFFMQDVKNYIWGGTDFYGFPAIYGEAFERGYQQVRPFTKDEERNGELFMLNKAFSLISGLSLAANSVGRTTLRFRNLEWFSQTMKPRARNLGLL